MSDDLSAVDDAQLERWAYGRAGGDDNRAQAAQLELARRAEATRAAQAEAERIEAERAEAARRAAELSGDDKTASAHPPLTDNERRHRRRMLATGWAGVAAAALALVGGVAVLSQPDPDPLAIFERPATERDLLWAERLPANGLAGVTLGPRVVDLENGMIAIAFRAAAVADGTSTEWDPYCLVVSDPKRPDELWTVGGACVSPEQFARQGLIAPLSASASDGTIGPDSARWGPIGAPRLEQGVAVDFADLVGTSVIDRMVYTDPEPDTSIVDDPSRLLLGPTTLLAGETADSNSYVLASTYLLRSETEGGQPTFCVRVGADDGTSSTACALLSAVRQAGIDVPISAGGNTWNIRIDPDGPNRQDTLELLN
ncbi:hypothetical protein [Microcella sp.]|uniref:hypothetical protein n=1 Tax=Microcella sp. TaxID=1913979 RepID=UPI00256DF8E0|nr:hypothetical protein [Microcella sp.]MBX9470504.1 hypothetical protein [Microcella sp.]